MRHADAACLFRFARWPPPVTSQTFVSQYDPDLRRETIMLCDDQAGTGNAEDWKS